MFNIRKNASFIDIEKEILKLWADNSLLEKIKSSRRGSKKFSFYDGPPFATGLPHYGHLLASIIKDSVLRYKTMKGFDVSRRFGWDCHGVPVEHEVEKSFSPIAKGQQVDIGYYNGLCESVVLKYTAEWQETINRIGRIEDFTDIYKTMDPNYMESIWWVFKTLYDKGLLYEDFKVMPFSTALRTPLSNFEAGENYKEVTDPAPFVKFEILGESSTFLLAWTTTPWTLVSNLALAINSDIDYVVASNEKTQEKYVMSRNAFDKFRDNFSLALEKGISCKDLKGKSYVPLFPYFRDRGNSFVVIESDHVTADDGTGIVHMAPAFGEEDFYACKREGIEAVCPVDERGCFCDCIEEYRGVFVKDADKKIISDLKGEGKIFHVENVLHRYPYCYRSDTPLIYRAMKTWFFRVESFRDMLVKAVENIRWVPEHIKYGRFANWIANARDWAISRNRFWGTPLPVWKSEDGDVCVVGSVAELEALSGKKVENLHRHFLDGVTFVKDGKTFKRIEEVLDCWFESGSMPYAQLHYPFENAEKFADSFPSDFIAEGIDQTRGWFYALNVISTALFDKPAFKNVIVNGIVLAQDGNKMSKRLKNYPAPEKMLDNYGADAMRLYLLCNNVTRGEDLKFCEEDLKLMLRQILIPLWNAYQGFFVTYAVIYQWEPEDDIFRKTPEKAIDRWMLSLVNKLAEDVGKAMDEYNLSDAVSKFATFIDNLTNWYIRRNRRRFWAEEASKDRDEAFSTLYVTLVTIAKMWAPFVPFICEEIFTNLRHDNDQISVHLCDYPECNDDFRDPELEKSMECIQKIVSLGHSIRKKHSIKVRQPLPKVTIATNDDEVIGFARKEIELILDELNVKNLEICKGNSAFVSTTIKPNFPVLGKKAGKHMKALKAIIEDFSTSDVEKIVRGGNVVVTIDGNDKFEVGGEDVAIHKEVLPNLVADIDEDVAVILDTSLDESLIIEGIARDVVNKINSQRRDGNFNVVDRITVEIATSDAQVLKAYELHREYIEKETLTTSWNFVEDVDGTTWNIGDVVVKIKVTKAGDEG